MYLQIIIMIVIIINYFKMLKLENIQVFELWAVLISLLTFWLCLAQVWASLAGRAAAEGWVRGGSLGTEPAAETVSQKFTRSRQELSGFGARVPYSCSVVKMESGEKAPDRLGLYVLDRSRHFEHLRVFYIKHSRQSL